MRVQLPHNPPLSRQAQPARQKPAEPMTQAQKDYIKDLITQRSEHPDAQEIRAMLNTMLTNKTLIPRQLASAAIDRLKEIPKNPAPLSEQAATYLQNNEDQDLLEALGQPKLPKGKFAIPASDHHGIKLQFYNVWIHPESKNLVLKRLVGAPGDWTKYPVRGSERKRVLELILSNPYKFQKAFGLHFKVCGRCDSPLTDPRSRAAGYGEICAGPMGWHYPDEDEARKILEARGEQF